MKKLLAVLSTFILILFSCKKDYTCECTTSYSGSTSTQSSTLHGKKKDAQASCEAGSTSLDGAKTTCVLK